jgi:hypothetical protein
VADRSDSGPPACTIAYAPRVPRTGAPWLLELDPTRGSVRAMLEDPVEGAVINVRRARCASRIHASLRAACEAYGLGPTSALELRWWSGVRPDELARIERVRAAVGAIPTRPAPHPSARSAA